MRRKLLVVAVLCVASAVIVWSDLLSPVPPPPVFGNCSMVASMGDCQTIISRYQAAVAAYNSSFLWWHEAGFQVPEGLLVLVALSFLGLPSSLNFKVRVSTLVQSGTLALAVVGFGVFAILAGLQILAQAGLASSSLALTGLRDVQYGLVAFVALAIGVVCLLLRRLNDGFRSALREGATFGAFAVASYEAGLLVASPRWAPVHVTNFAGWSLGGVDVLSNFVVIILSLGVLVLSLSTKLKGGPRVGIGRESP